MNPSNTASLSVERTTALITEEELRAELKLPHVNAVRWLRRKKKIPYVRLSYRTVRYDLKKVMAAIEKLEVKEAGPR